MGGTAWLFSVENKYYVTHDFDDDLCDLSTRGNAFEVDELIAESLAMLCNKGYITKYSCSGHPFPSCCYTVIEDCEQQLSIAKEDHIAVTAFGEAALAICDMDGYLSNEIYILFEKEYLFPTIPNGWNYVNGKLSSYVQATDTIDFFRTILLAIEQLNEWINGLPNNTSSAIA